MNKKNMMEMIKSCVINHHIYHTKMFCSTPKSRRYWDEHRSNKQKSQVKKTYSQKQHKYQKYISKNYWRVARANTFTVWLTISKYDYMISSNENMTNIESYSQGIFWWCRILWTWVLCIIQKALSRPGKWLLPEPHKIYTSQKMRRFVPKKILK